jgi:hypothetical protein
MKIMKIAIINSSDTAYNFATEKMKSLFASQGHEVAFSNRADMWSHECQKAYISAIFTWDLPNLIYDARALASRKIEVEVGGPAVTAMPEMLKENLVGLDNWIRIHTGLDERFEHVPGDYQVTFTSRGCPRACEFCLVNKLEGRKIIEYETFNIPVGVNPYVCDNNLLSTSWQHQQMVVDKLCKVKNLDLNSGFDDRIFTKDPDKYWDLYRHLRLECWRFAYDSPDQKEPIDFITRWLNDKGVDYRHIIVFCLVGGPGMSFGESQRRLQHLINIGCSPYPMRYRPLDSLEMNYTPPGWRKNWLELLFGYYGVPYIWRSCKWSDFLTKKVDEGKLLPAELGRILCQ